MDERRERLRTLTGEASGGAARSPADRDPRGPAPGDLYVLRETADFPVEWAILEQDPAATDLWLAVPADTNPLRGPGDLWLGAGEPGGPLCLRCRFAVRLPRDLFERGRRTGAVAPEATERAVTVHHDHERGALAPDPLGEEVTVDPEYGDWERAVLAAARAAAASAARRVETAAPATQPPGRRPLLALAAALALVALGLGAWALQLRQELDRRSLPLLIDGSREVVVGSDFRGSTTLEWRASDERLLVFLVLAGEALEHGSYRVELSDAEERVLWTSREVPRGPVPELNLVIHRRFLDRARQPLRLLLFGIDGGREQRLATVPVRIEGADQPPRDAGEVE